MFGIEDPMILAPYILMVLCVIFSAWYGIRNWNRDDAKDDQPTENKKKS